MKNSLFAVLAVCVLAVSVQAQDLIIMNDGTTINGKVLSGGDGQRAGLKAGQIEISTAGGQTKYIPTADVSEIVYKNGHRVYYNRSSRNSSSAQNQISDAQRELEALYSGKITPEEKTIPTFFYGEEDTSKTQEPVVVAVVPEVREEPVVKAEKTYSTSNYVVVKGDNLWNLSKRHYGSGYQWQHIWEHNKHIKNPNLIYPGDELLVPSALSD